MAKVTYGWTVTILSYLQVDAWPKSLRVDGYYTEYLRVDDGHYTKLPTGRCVAKVTYGWTVIILSYLRVDA